MIDRLSKIKNDIIGKNERGTKIGMTGCQLDLFVLVPDSTQPNQQFVNCATAETKPSALLPSATRIRLEPRLSVQTQGSFLLVARKTIARWIERGYCKLKLRANYILL